MKKKTLWQRFKSATPKLAKLFQALSGAIAALPIYYSSLPEEFKTTIPTDWLKWITGAGLIVAFILQFLERKEK